MKLLAKILLCGFSIYSTGPLAAQQAISPEVQTLYEHARGAQAADQTDAAIADYLKILRLDPKLGAAYNNLGRLYYNEGRYSDAIPVLVRGLKIDPSMHPAEIILGASYFQTGVYDKAVSSLEAALRALPDDRFARITLVHSLIQQNSNDAAIQQLHKLTAIDPKDQEAWYLLGKLQLQLSQDAFARVHSIDPDSPLSHVLSGEIMDSMKNTAGSIAEYKRALELAPNDPSAMEHLADVYWHDGEWNEARDSFQAILKQGGSNCLVQWKLANSMDELNESAPEALKYADVALATCPTLGQARVERARILLRLGKPADALPDLLTAEKTAPDEPSIQILLAKVYRALGNPTEAAAADAKFKQLLQAEHAGQEKHAADVIRANP
ncbi:tetratricopeptide repeat protein [Granulicella arctica]|uniref:tetratricopeptide repeat protein n=1 Tax=Granulicella arctica TaxID=940613 RepID=UPI0021DF592C|nr:tetratricopeptide repeat protein [Granulicella arctica]